MPTSGPAKPAGKHACVPEQQPPTPPDHTYRSPLLRLCACALLSAGLCALAVIVMQAGDPDLRGETAQVPVPQAATSPG